MARVKRGVTSHAKHKKIYKAAKGYYGRRKNTIRVVRPFGLNYSRFIAGLAKTGITVDRKVLSDLAIREPAAFQAIVEKAKAALPA